MPFGPNCEYANFAACVRAHKDKDDPKAYCGELMRRTEEHCMNKAKKGATSRVVKIDQDRHLVFGFFNVCLECDGQPVIDSHDDQIDPSELESAAYLFNLEFRELNERHRGFSKGRLIESFFMTREKIDSMVPLDTADREAIITSFMKAVPEGAWWGGFFVEDTAAWDKIKKGEYRMFSIEGTAIREEDE